MKKGVLIIFFFAILLQFINADIISLNSGGDEGLVINPDTYLEGFFSGSEGVQVLSSCGNGILEEPYEECDDGNFVSGDGCSALCQDETEEPPIEPPIEPPVEPPIEPGEVSIRVDPLIIERNMLVNSNIEENIGITNLDNANRINFSVSSSGFDPDLVVLFWDESRRTWVQSFTLFLSGGEIKNLRVRFSSSSNVTTYYGLLVIDGKIVNVTLNVQEKLLLFDSNIIVLNENYLVPRGDKLRTSVTLIPMGDKERMDVTLNYIIKDYEGTWEKNPTMKFLRGVYEKFIVEGRIKQYEGKVFGEEILEPLLQEKPQIPF
jgi:cysteine-rich repeat protein